MTKEIKLKIKNKIKKLITFILYCFDILLNTPLWPLLPSVIEQSSESFVSVIICQLNIEPEPKTESKKQWIWKT